MAWPTKEEREARLKAKAESEAQEFTLADVARLIQDTADSVRALKEEVDSLKLATPVMRPMELPEDPGDRRREAIASLKKGEESLGVIGQIPVDFQGQRVAGRRNRPAFSPGQAVRIRPRTRREGFPREGDPFPEKWDVDTRGKKRVNPTWRYWTRLFRDQPEESGVFPRDVVWDDVLKLSRCEGVGVLKASAFMSKGDEWKYKGVRIKGLTTDWGDGFYEYELEAC